jgi:hypothetical protein
MAGLDQATSFPRHAVPGSSPGMTGLGMRGLSLIALTAMFALAGCGDLPRPFMGNPGATARRLAIPPPPRLLVPQPTDAMLTEASGKQFAQALAVALLNNEVPAVADSPRTDDWRLVVHAAIRGGNVVPVYSVLDPKGADQGKTEGPPVPAADWSAATPAMLKKTADASAPGIGALLTHIEASLMQADRTACITAPPMCRSPPSPARPATAISR